MKICSAILGLAAALCGCVPVRVVPPAGTSHTRGALSICELAAHGISEGLTARIKASYETDRSQYAYLSSGGCGKSGVLNVGDLEPISEGTLKAFYDAIDQRCTGSPYACVIEADVDADISVIRGQDGKPAAEILKVHGFSFLGRE